MFSRPRFQSKHSPASLRSRRAGRGIEPLEPRIVLSASGFGEEADGGGGSIVNGTVIPQSAYPTVGIVNNGCTGTLISPRHVLTAAHCTSSGAGTFRLDGVNYTAIQQIDHFSQDIAIMVLAEEITDVTPSEILRERPIDRATGSGVGEELILVGYGNGGTTGNPASDFGTLREGFTELETVTDTKLLWWMVGAEWNGQDESNTAYGDSGGPAFVRRDYDGDGTFELYVAGTTRGSVAGFDPWNNDHADDMRVDAFADWIDDVLDDDIPEPPEDDHVDNPGPDATVIVIDSNGEGSETGQIGHFGDRDLFQFELTEASDVQINLTETNGGLDTYLRLYDATGSQIASDDDDGPGVNSQLTIGLEAGVTYYVSAGAYNDADTGMYIVQIDATPGGPGDDDHADLPGAGATPLIFDASGHVTGTGEIEVNSDRDVFSFSIAATTQATIAQTATGGGLDTYLRLYDAGAQITFDDDGGAGLNSRIVRSLGPGTYYASAGAYQGFSETVGTYDLVIDVDPSAVLPPGDFDGDQDVDGDDFLVWQSSFGVNGGGDADGDGDTDGDDFLIWQGNLGAGSGSAAVAARLAKERIDRGVVRPPGRNLLAAPTGRDALRAGERSFESDRHIPAPEAVPLTLSVARGDDGLRISADGNEFRNESAGERSDAHDHIFAGRENWRTLRFGLRHR